MIKGCVIVLILFLTGCNSAKKETRVFSQDEFVKSFFQNLTAGRGERGITFFENLFKDSTEYKTVLDGLDKLSEKVQSEYGTVPAVSVISEEFTTYQNLSAVFVVVKIESPSKFGYYFLTVHEKTNKIIIISEFAMPRPKR